MHRHPPCPPRQTHTLTPLSPREALIAYLQRQVSPPCPGAVRGAGGGGIVQAACYSPSPPPPPLCAWAPRLAAYSCQLSPPPLSHYSPPHDAHEPHVLQQLLELGPQLGHLVQPLLLQARTPGCIHISVGVRGGQLGHLVQPLLSFFACTPGHSHTSMGTRGSLGKAGGRCPSPWEEAAPPHRHHLVLLMKVRPPPLLPPGCPCCLPRSSLPPPCRC